MRKEFITGLPALQLSGHGTCFTINYEELHATRSLLSIMEPMTASPRAESHANRRATLLVFVISRRNKVRYALHEGRDRFDSALSG